MSNKYLYILLGTLMAILWYHVGAMEALNMGQESGFSTDWWFATILAVALGAGSTGGNDAVSILVEGVKGYISTLIVLGLLATLGTLIYNFGILGQAFDLTWLGITIATFLLAGLITNLTVSYLKKAI